MGTQSVVKRPPHHTRTLVLVGVTLYILQKGHETMYDLFYIVEVHDHWYNLRLKNTHYCVGCGSDIENLLGTVGHYVKKYKTAERVYLMIRGLSDGGRMSPATFDQYKAQYDSGKSFPFKQMVYDAVALAKKEDRENSPYNRAKRQVRTVVREDHIDIVQEVVKEVLPMCAKRKITPHKIKRTFAPET